MKSSTSPPTSIPPMPPSSTRMPNVDRRRQQTGRQQIKRQYTEETGILTPANHIGTDMAAQLVRQQDRARKLLLLHQMVSATSAVQTQAELVRSIVNSIHTVLGFPNVALFRVEAGLGQLVLEAMAGSASQRYPVGYVQPLGTGAQGGADPEVRCIVANDARQSLGHMPHSAPAKPKVVFPIKTGGTLTHLLEVSDLEINAFDDTDLIVLQAVADHLGLMLFNAARFKELNEKLTTQKTSLQNIAHDLRTPLSVIAAYADLLACRLPKEEEEHLRFTAIMLEQTERMNRLINQLIPVSNAGFQAYSFEKFSLSELLHALALLWAPVLAKRDLRLVMNITDLAAYVYGDSEYLIRAVQNLLDNACKYTPQGGSLTLSCWQEGNEIFVSLADTGVGVAPQYLPRLFERFYRVAETSHQPGMGVGLAMVHQIIVRHEGRIFAHSLGVGHGLTVTFVLPAIE